MTRVLLGLGLVAWVARIARQAGAPGWPLALAIAAASALAVVIAWRRRPGAWLDGPRLVLVLLGLWLLPSVYGSLGGDGVQYYILLRSPLLDLDLDFDNDFAGLGAAPVVSVQGEATSRMPVGTALVWAPAFLAVHVTAKVGEWLGLAGPADGFGPAYTAAVATATYVFVFAALLLLEGALRARHGRGVALLAVAGIWLGTPLAFYMTAAATMSHGASAGTAILMVLAWLRAREAEGARPWAWAGLAGGLLVAIRPQDGVLLALPALDALWRGRSRGRALLAFLAGPLVFGLLQLLVWLRLYGLDFAGVISGQSYVGQTPLFPLELMLSARHGLFTWTPLYLLAPLGWLALGRRDPPLALLCALGFALSVLVNSAMQDWWGSESFGQRRLLGVTPLFALGVAEALALLRRRPMVMLAGATAVVVFWNSQLAVVYNSRMLAPRTEALSLDQMGQGQAELLYRRLLAWERRLPPRLFVLLYENLRGVWLDEGARALGETVDLGRQADGSIEPAAVHGLLADGWYGADREGEAGFRRCRGRRAAWRVPVRTPGPFEVTVRLRSEMGALPVRVALEVNGARVGEEPLAGEWAEHDFAVPAHLWRTGFNEVALAFSTTPRDADPAHQGRNAPASVDWVRLHRQATPQGPW